MFSDIVSSGQEIPYEIEEPGDSFAFCHYRPLTAKFVRDNATELRELESFRVATERMRRSELAATYLEEAGIAPPADSFERSTLAVTYFLARLWDGASEFELDPERFDAALAEVEECAEPGAGEVEAIVPLVGFGMPVGRLDLHGASIVRADTVDVPAEAARGERPSKGEWEPSFLVSARVALDEDGGLGGAGDRVAKTFERIVTALRLSGPGGVGLGPHGWVRVAGDRWRRIATGAARPRPGGYRLDEGAIGRLEGLSRTLGVHKQRVGKLRRPLMRFEAGLDRRTPMDALNDHLLSLRFLLEGEGPAGMALAVRASSVSEEGDRGEVKELIEAAIALERQMWCGETAEIGDRTPERVTRGLEGVLRGILRSAVSGDLGADLRVAADEALLADGFAVGESFGGTTEWDMDPVPEPDDVDFPVESQVETEIVSDGDGEVRTQRLGLDREPVGQDDPVGSPTAEVEAGAASEPDDAAFERFERDPDPRIRASRGVEGERPARRSTVEGQPRESLAHTAEDQSEEPRLELWMAEGDDAETMDFPSRPNHLDELSRPPMDREEVRERVEYLFPRTETNWKVGGEGERQVAAS